MGDLHLLVNLNLAKNTEKDMNNSRDWDDEGITNERNL
jgi:hypothetical protein